MTIPARAVLRDQLHCMSHDGTVVMTAQRWADPDAEPLRSWLRLVRNGRVRRTRQFTGSNSHRELEAFWADLAEMYEPTALTEDQMWERLRAIAKIEPAECASKDCPGRLPVGWLICPACGRHVHRVAGGAMSRARRRGDIVIPASAFQRSNTPS